MTWTLYCAQRARHHMLPRSASAKGGFDRWAATSRRRPRRQQGLRSGLEQPPTRYPMCHSFTLIPDAVFALRYRSTGRYACFFIEADRGTMPIERADLGQTSIRRKLVAYQAALKARQHVERFAFHNLRILVVTTGAKSLRSMISMLSTVTQGIATGRFLFAEHPAVTGADPLSLLWTTNGTPVRIDAPLRAANAA
ncbi:MAG: hypothetical protein ABL907_21750 [Hyphomicrobium sp.]